MPDSEMHTTSTTAAICVTIPETQQRPWTKWIWHLHYHGIPNGNTLIGGEMHIYTKKMRSLFYSCPRLASS